MIWSLLFVAMAAGDDLPAPPILGGTDVADGDAGPVLAVVDRDGEVYCTAVLLTPSVAVTAAHCHNRASAVWVDTMDASDVQARVSVAASTPHPGGEQRPDVALLELAEPVRTPPAQLWSSCDGPPVEDGSSAIIEGWGATDAQATVWTDRLQRATVALDQARCTDDDVGCWPALQPDGELTTIGDGVDTCVGDSGGPIWVGTGGERWLLGVASRAVIDREGPPCGAGGIFVRLDPIRPWLQERGQVDLPCQEPAEGRCGCNHENGGPILAFTLLSGFLVRRRRASR